MRTMALNYIYIYITRMDNYKYHTKLIIDLDKNIFSYFNIYYLMCSC